MDQLPLFADAATIASLEATITDLGLSLADALEVQRGETFVLRNRCGMLETLFMEQARINSTVGDRLRLIEIRLGLRSRELPELALCRAVPA